MKSITIHNLDSDLAQAIEQKAQAAGLSLNKTIKKTLRLALGLDEKLQKKADFSDVAGSWTEAEYQEFMATQQDFSQVDPKDWQ